MEFPSLTAVLISLIVLVPGYITHSTVGMITLRRSEQKELLFLRFLAFSALNLVPWLPFLYTLQSLKWGKPVPHGAVLNLFIIIFLCPAIFGLLIGAADRLNLLIKVLSLLRLCPLHPIPTAWDYKFSELSQKGPCMVLITTTEGEFYFGRFGGESLASSEKDERDIYLERHYRIEDGEWKPMPGSEGLLIRGSEIRALEFFSLPCNSHLEERRLYNRLKRFAPKKILLIKDQQKVLKGEIHGRKPTER